MNVFQKTWHTLKAFVQLPGAAAKALYTLSSLHLSEWFRGLTASWKNPTYSNLAKIAHRNPYAGPGLRLISLVMASIPLTVEVSGGEGTEVLADHELLTLLHRPSPRQSYQHLCDTFVNHAFFAGELFIERRGPSSGPNQGKAKRLYLHRPDRLQSLLVQGAPAAWGDKIRASDEVISRLRPETRALNGPGDIVGYRILQEDGTPKDYTIDEVLHVRVFYNPLDEDRGFALMASGARAIESMESADDWNKNISNSGGRVPGYLEPRIDDPSKQLTEDQIKYIEEVHDKRWKDRSRKGMPLVLSGAFRYTEASITPKDADFLGSDERNFLKICAVLGIPPLLLAHVKSGTLTDAGLDSEMKAVIVLRILPFLELLLAELNAWLVPAWGNDLRIWYDKDQIEALQEDMTQKYRRYREACGVPFMTRAEAREALSLGTEDVEGEFFVPISMQADRADQAGAGGVDDEPPTLRRLKGMAGDDYDAILHKLTTEQAA